MIEGYKVISKSPGDSKPYFLNEFHIDGRKYAGWDYAPDMSNCCFEHKEYAEQIIAQLDTTPEEKLSIVYVKVTLEYEKKSNRSWDETDELCAILDEFQKSFKALGSCFKDLVEQIRLSKEKPME